MKSDICFSWPLSSSCYFEFPCWPFFVSEPSGIELFGTFSAAVGCFFSEPGIAVSSCSFSFVTVFVVESSYFDSSFDFVASTFFLFVAFASPAVCFVSFGGI